MNQLTYKRVVTNWMYIKDKLLIDDKNAIYKIGDYCLFIMNDNYKNHITGYISNIGFCNNCISIEEVNDSGQISLLFTEHIKMIKRLED